MNEPAQTPAEPAPLGENQVRITGSKGSQVFDLRLTAPLSVRYEVKYAIADNEWRACACALALCVSKIGHAVGRYDGKPLEYGARVIEWLLEQGVDYIDAFAQGRRAWAFLCRDLPRAAEVKSAEDFFGPTWAGSTSS